MIKITNAYLDTIINGGVLQVIAKKPFTAKTSYWLVRVFNKLEKEGEIYFSERRKLIEKHAKRHDKDGEEGEKKWKAGDMISDGQNVSLNDAELFMVDLRELTSIEINLGLDKIPFDLDKEPSCTVEEMGILMPLIEIKE